MARRKKGKKKHVIPGPEELCGLKRGDTVFCFRYPDKLLSRGEIKWFHEKTEEGPAFTFLDEVSGSFRLSLIDDVIAEPTKQQKANINGAVVRNIRRSNQKPKTR